MEKIRVNEYVRTHDGRIYEISYYSEEEKRYISVTEDDWYPVYKSEIKSHSENIIDLIEVGDYVNGEKILSISPKRDYLYAERIGFEAKDIETILTKEQHERGKYVVGG